MSQDNSSKERAAASLSKKYQVLMLHQKYDLYIHVNPFTVGNPLLWQNFLLPECLRDSIV